MRFWKCWKTIFDPKIALVHQKCPRLHFFFLPQKNRTKNIKVRAIFRFFWFWPNDVFPVFWRHIRSNTSFGQNRKNRKIALIFMFLVRFFCGKKKKCNLGHFWWTRAILGSKIVFQHFQNRILRKNRFFDFHFGLQNLRNLASRHFFLGKNHENLKIEFIRFIGSESRQESIAELRKMIRTL